MRRTINLIVWIIFVVALLVLGNQNGIDYILPVLWGGALGLLGIVNIYKSFFGWFIFDIGLGLLVYPVAKILGYNFNYIVHIKEIFLGVCFLISMELFFDDTLRNKKAKKRCTEPFEAKCVSFTKEGDSTYVPVYRYHIDGKTNTFYGNSLSSINPKLGDIITVFVNKQNKNDIYCPTSKAILMIRYLIGLLILSFSTGAVVIL